MQSSDAQNKVIQNDVFNDLASRQSMKTLTQRIATARANGAVKHVISQLPKKGEYITINGLICEVKIVDYKRGEMRLKLVGPDPVATKPEGD